MMKYINDKALERVAGGNHEATSELLVIFQPPVPIDLPNGAYFGFSHRGGCQRPGVLCALTSNEQVYAVKA